MEEARQHLTETKAQILTGVLGKARSDADLQGFAGRFQRWHVSLTLNKQDLSGAAPAQEAPVFLLQLHLQSEQQKRRRQSQRRAPLLQNPSRFLYSRVIKLQR